MDDVSASSSLISRRGRRGAGGKQYLNATTVVVTRTCRATWARK